jgi:glycosyltransferase involved in cell wall biosynthesis
LNFINSNEISVVIPTCNRKQRLLSLLSDLNRSTYPLSAVIIVDSGEDRLAPEDCAAFGNLAIQYLWSERSVCIQRNMGIRMATSPWILLCDDDVEVPAGYAQKLIDHLTANEGTGAVSGLFLQKEKHGWTEQYPLSSAGSLLWTFIFQTGIWGEIEVESGNPLVRKIKQYYQKKGNHISRAGWPVLTQFTGNHFNTPVYSLGAALVKREWLLDSPFDEVLDPHGLGDNYGVTTGLPGKTLAVLPGAFVYHHKEPDNRLKKPLQYYRRVLALDYFAGIRPALKVRRSWLLWSLFGNLLGFIRGNEADMTRPVLRAIKLIAFGRNPYREAADKGIKVLEPTLPEQKPIRPDRRSMLWFLFFWYLLLLVYTGLHHEPWGDEVHSWNIAKASGNFLDLIANRRYEGHPPVWYTMMWTAAAFSHQLIVLQLTHWLIAAAVVWLVLFKSPFPFSTRALLPFGYYFLFEYGILSRNYAPGVLLAFCLCLALRKKPGPNLVLYYTLLFCLSNVHLLTLFLAAAMHLYLILWLREQGRDRKMVFFHGLLGLALLLPAVWFILLPADSEVNPAALAGSWASHQMSHSAEPLLRAFLPIPAWWNYHFWNTQFLIAAQAWLTGVVIALLLLLFIYYALRADKKSLALFTANLLFSYLLSTTIFTLATARHAGFLFIGFIVAWWLYNTERPAGLLTKFVVNTILVIQLGAGLFAIAADIRFPFSNTNRIPALIREVPAGSLLVTDYWTMNAITAYTDRPVYCVDVQRPLSFLLFNSRLKAIDADPHRYTNGLLHLFKERPIDSAYLLSLSSPQLLSRIDNRLNKDFLLAIMDQTTGAIERGSDVYLYKVKPLTPNDR